MPKNKRLSPNDLTREKGYLTNLKNIASYKSQNSDYDVAAIQTVEDALDAALVEETRLVDQLARIRDVIAENSALLIEKNDGAVIQVAAQFGEDSPEFQSLGRKRKSERSTNRRPKPGSGSTSNS